MIFRGYQTTFNNLCFYTESTPVSTSGESLNSIPPRKKEKQSDIKDMSSINTTMNSTQSPKSPPPAKKPTKLVPQSLGLFDSI